ncbi:hypothetical protein Tco_0939319 [Tanacetum coccineum]|uniref:Uncharacterized protein n=1 Tax=Tanacetum coccineum TaxID=301880 RepID=A0ABQ5DKG3_9ASTR
MKRLGLVWGGVEEEDPEMEEEEEEEMKIRKWKKKRKDECCMKMGKAQSGYFLIRGRTHFTSTTCINSESEIDENRTRDAWREIDRVRDMALPSLETLVITRSLFATSDADTAPGLLLLMIHSTQKETSPSEHKARHIVDSLVV